MGHLKKKLKRFSKLYNCLRTMAKCERLCSKTLGATAFLFFIFFGVAWRLRAQI
jgi:hypothetical protein